MISPLKDRFPVKQQIARIRLGEFVGKLDFASLKRLKILFERRLGKKFLQPAAEQNAMLVIDRDEARIERGVVEAGKTQAVAGA